MFKINVVEDEKNLANLLEAYLKKEGYECRIFNNGEDAMANVSDDCHLWVLDIMLPGSINGYDLIKEIRKYNPIMPVIFTSARDQDIDKIMGLELGSDDYISKPYSPREVMLRIKNLLNRTYKMDNQKIADTIKYDIYTINKDKRSVYVEDELINLTSKEYDLLIFLLENIGKAFDRNQLLDSIWGSEYFGSDRVVDDLMRRLRSKMPNLKVETIYGYGYRLK